MKRNNHFYYQCFFVLFSALLLSSCKPVSFFSFMNLDPERYVIQDVYYQIYEVEPLEYHYKIGTSHKTFVNEIQHKYPPRIDSLGDGVIRLFTSAGTNAHSVQYFSINEDMVSKIFPIYTVYADYVDESKPEEYLLAYFDFPRNVLLIKDIFNEQGFSTEIDRGFISATCNRLVILNENEIYLDYDVFADGYSDDDLISGKPVEFKNIREVVKFKF